MSWESSLEYYRWINSEINRRRGGFHSAKVVMVSVDFSEIEILQHQNKWDEAAALLVIAAKQLVQAGAECIVLCTNTMHKIAPEILQAVPVPFLHIADATAAEILANGFRKAGLLGTRFTMEENFYKERLSDVFGIEVIIPEKQDREVVHAVIYQELVRGIISPASRQAYIEIIANLAQRGAQCIILGCTEIGLLIGQDSSPIPIFDTARIHAISAVNFALQGEQKTD
jgi:aspartate racemase